MSWRQRAVLLGVMMFGAFGDIALSRGMKNVGQISLHRLSDLISAIFTPWVGAGVLLLLLFFVAYLTALSFADLTYVLPATAMGYIVLALIAKFFLHEDISATRWTGIALIALGVGFVTQGPAQTPTARGMQDSTLDSGEIDHPPSPVDRSSYAIDHRPSTVDRSSRAIDHRPSTVTPPGSSS